jgi:HSP20 family protein
MPHLFREAHDLADDLRRLFDDIETRLAARGVSGECVPALDVVETTEAVEIYVDLPGVEADQVRVLIKAGSVLIAGEKPAGELPGAEATFHLVERGFGRFARVVRLTAAVDAGRAEATLEAGELRVVVPKILERRGRDILVPVRRGRQAA